MAIWDASLPWVGLRAPIRQLDKDQIASPRVPRSCRARPPYRALSKARADAALSADIFEYDAGTAEAVGRQTCYRIACIGAPQLSAGNTTGMVFVNHPPMVRADLSFGGIRRSGYGGELPGPGGPLPGFWH